MNVYARYSVVQSISPQIKWSSAGSATMQPGTAKRPYHNWQLFGVGVEAIVWQSAGSSAAQATTHNDGDDEDFTPINRRKRREKEEREVMALVKAFLRTLH